MQQVGQVLVVLGVAIIVLGVAVAAVQAVIKALREASNDGLGVRAQDLPDGLTKVLIELIKQGGGLAIAAVGVVVLFVGLQLMNDGAQEESKASAVLGADSADRRSLAALGQR